MSNIAIKKPAKNEPAANRFAGAKLFASGETEALEDTAPAATAKEKKNTATAKKDRPKLTQPKLEETTRENFDMPISQRQEMLELLVNSKKFRYKRDFLIQCVADGLKKYKGQ
ncbi:hypothetical protein [Acinetobacter sp. ANC 3813]|uniref:hypothetical protein n=1 Tax=Acinetobacter sp. ANC 3813 TaxID=1977873 RepID=UPI000A35AD4E|nr:hypothetical protein [Acinetobacter sp. ANC 3813]OTG87856.1 hypothetical protein B9T34_16095 [Acinetobacter sp. ANC 3813]